MLFLKFLNFFWIFFDLFKKRPPFFLKKHRFSAPKKRKKWGYKSIIAHFCLFEPRVSKKPPDRAVNKKNVFFAEELETRYYF